MGLHQKAVAEESLESIDFKDKNVLDIGCGNGSLSIDIFQTSGAKNWTGIDTAMDRISTAKQTVKDLDLKNIDFVLGKAENLSKFENNTFDIIFCNMAFQQFKDPETALKEIKRVLKHGGLAIINFNEAKSPFWIKQEEIENEMSGKNNEISATKKIDRQEFLIMANIIGFGEILAESRDSTVFYKNADEVIKDFQLTPNSNLNIIPKFRTYLESIKTGQGIPETWKMVFAKLVK